MKKNRTEVFPPNIIKFIPKIQTNISNREKMKQLEQKIDKEIKENPGGYIEVVKQNLTKNEITKEVYLSKNISKEKRSQSDLLISKIDKSDELLKRKNKILNKLSKENASFLKTYKLMKKAELKKGRITGQQEYLNNVVKLYISKDYDLSNGAINTKENLFKYSILNDQDFGNDINGDALRIIKEMDNEEFLKEQQLIFEFQDELMKVKANNKITHPAEILIKNKVVKEKDYGIDEKSYINWKKKKSKLPNLNKNKNKIEDKKENNNIIKEDIKKDNQEHNIENNKEENKGDNKIDNNEDKNKNNKNNINKDKNEETNKNDEAYDNFDKENSKPRPSFLYLQIRKDIKNMQKKFIDFEKMKNENKNVGLMKIKELFKPKHSMICHSFINPLNKNINTESENEENGKKEKNNQHLKYNSTEVDINNINNNNPISNLNENKRKKDKKVTFFKKNIRGFSRFSILPNINKSSEDIHKNINDKNLTGSDTPKACLNLNLTQEENKLILNRKNSELFKNGNKSKNDSKNNLINFKNGGNKILKLLFNKRACKMPIDKDEYLKQLKKFKTNRKSIYKSVVQKPTESNLRGFTTNFQRITGNKNFGDIHLKNKYLKKHNFSHLISNYDLLTEEDNEPTNVRKVDEKIINILYDSADYLLGEKLLNNKVVKG